MSNQQQPTAAKWYDLDRLIDAAWVERARTQHPSLWAPGPGEMWWWLGIPIATAAIVLYVGIALPDVYMTKFLPEGYGYLEVSHFLVPLSACLICLWLLFRPSVRQDRTLKITTALFALAAFYIAGEEHSWGQHFFGWSTPDAWKEVNRQDETNLHNTLDIFNHTPQRILEIGILIGGIILPLWNRYKEPLQSAFLKLYVPSLAILPIALTCFGFKILKSSYKPFESMRLIYRPSEAMETFFYLFILFYVIIYARRILALDRTRGSL
jgi:hypothetical protein